MTQVLQIDEVQIKHCYDLFRYADDNTWLSCRSFFDDGDGVFEIQAVKVNNGDATIEAIIAAAMRAAQSPRATVFCPPIATFNNSHNAAEKDLANGLALSVECDQRPKAALHTLEALLGSATLVVESGGEWVDPETGEIQNKVHLHWRLSKPTRDTASHALLKKARTLATALVGGDASNKPIVHPIRWPGTWHRKSNPRLATIVSETSGEIELSEAVEMLGDALTARGIGLNDMAPKSDGAENGTGESRDTAALIAEIISGHDYHATLVALAMRYMLGGMSDAQIILTLRGIMESVPVNIRDLKDSSVQTGRWRSRFNDIPRAISTAREKIGKSGAGNHKDIDLKAWGADRYSGNPPPMEWLVEGTIPKAVPVKRLPPYRKTRRKARKPTIFRPIL